MGTQRDAFGKAKGQGFTKSVYLAIIAEASGCVWTLVRRTPAPPSTPTSCLRSETSPRTPQNRRGCARHSVTGPALPGCAWPDWGGHCSPVSARNEIGSVCLLNPQNRDFCKNRAQNQALGADRRLRSGRKFQCYMGLSMPIRLSLLFDITGHQIDHNRAVNRR